MAHPFARFGFGPRLGLPSRAFFSSASIWFRSDFETRRTFRSALWNIAAFGRDSFGLAIYAAIIHHVGHGKNPAAIGLRSQPWPWLGYQPMGLSQPLSSMPDYPPWTTPRLRNRLPFAAKQVFHFWVSQFYCSLQNPMVLTGRGEGG